MHYNKMDIKIMVLQIHIQQRPQVDTLNPGTPNIILLPAYMKNGTGSGQTWYSIRAYTLQKYACPIIYRFNSTK